MCYRHGNTVCSYKLRSQAEGVSESSSRCAQRGSARNKQCWVMKRTFRKSYEVKGARSLLFIIADHMPSFPSASRLHNMHLCDYAYDMHLQYVITQPPVIHHDTCCILHIRSLQYEKSYKLLTMWKVLQLHQHTVYCGLFVHWVKNKYS